MKRVMIVLDGEDARGVRSGELFREVEEKLFGYWEDVGR